MTEICQSVKADRGINPGLELDTSAKMCARFPQGPSSCLDVPAPVVPRLVLLVADSPFDTYLDPNPVLPNTGNAYGRLSCTTCSARRRQTRQMQQRAAQQPTRQSSRREQDGYY
ncbi:hypothetical protein FRC12_013806 [Ceratobasidium sp. 428]|nr:hypothetical protein FRC12_013806 [Ceratobasidium sp. 428]